MWHNASVLKCKPVKFRMIADFDVSLGMSSRRLPLCILSLW